MDIRPTSCPYPRIGSIKKPSGNTVTIGLVVALQFQYEIGYPANPVDLRILLLLIIK